MRTTTTARRLIAVTGLLVLPGTVLAVALASGQPVGWAVLYATCAATPMAWTLTRRAWRRAAEVEARIFREELADPNRDNDRDDLGDHQ